MSSNNPTWGVPSHSPPERGQDSSIVGGLAPAAVAIVIGVAMAGSGSQGPIIGVQSFDRGPDFEFGSRAFFGLVPENVKVSGDTNGATTETVTLVAQVTSTDANGATTENVTLAAVILATDVNSTTTENASPLITITSANIRGPPVFTYAAAVNQSRIYNAHYLVRTSVNTSDVNGATSEVAALTAQIPATDVNSVTTENASTGVPISASDVNSTVFDFSDATATYIEQEGASSFFSESILFVPSLAQIPVSDVNGSTTEGASTGIAVAAIPGALKAIAAHSYPQPTPVSIVVQGLALPPATPKSDTDVNGATTEATALTAQITSSDTNGATTEGASNGIAGATLPGAIRAIQAHSPPQPTPVSITVQGLALGPLPPVIPPAIALQGGSNVQRVVRQVPQPEPLELKIPEFQTFAFLVVVPPIFNVIVPGGTNQGWQVRGYEVPERIKVQLASRIVKIPAAAIGTPSSSDTNGATTENTTLTAAITASDANGATTEGATNGAPISASDTGTGTDSASVTVAQIPTSDANGTVTDNATLTAAISATDANGTTTEVGSPNTPVGASDTNGTTTETASVNTAQIPASDSSTGIDDASNTRALISTSDTNGATGEGSSSGTIDFVSSSDINGTTTESASVIATITASDSNGVVTETSAPRATVSDSQVATGTDNQVVTAALTSSQAGTGDDQAVSGAWLTKSDSDTNGLTIESATAVEIALSGNVATGRVVVPKAPVIGTVHTTDVLIRRIR